MLALLALLATTIVTAPQPAEAQADTLIAEGIVDNDRVAGLRWVRTDFSVPATADYTIETSWPGNAQVRFSIFDKATDERIATAETTSSPNAWTGQLRRNVQYELAVWSVDGVANFTATMRTANGPLRILTHPAATSVSAGSTAVFSVSAAGTGAVTYQWFRNRVAIPGETGSTLRLTGVRAADTGDVIRALVSNGASSLPSNAAVLTVAAPGALQITQQPTDLGVTQGATATFSVAATSNRNISYQWFRNRVPIAGETGSNLRLTGVSSANDGDIIRVLASDGAASLPSNAAVLSVLASNFQIEEQPADTAVNPGGTATFGVATTGADNVTYQWFRNRSPIAGETGPTVELDGIQDSNDGDVIRVLVSDGASSVPSEAAVVRVGGLANAVDSGTLDRDLAAGPRSNRTNLEVLESGIHTLYFDWQGNADMLMSVFRADTETLVGSTSSSALSDQLSVFLSKNQSYFVRVWSADGSASYDVTKVSANATPPPVVPTIFENKVLNYDLWNTTQEKQNGFRASVDGPITIKLDWDSNADFDLEVRRGVFSPIATAPTTNAKSRSVTFNADADVQYFAVITMKSGSGNWVLRKIQEIPDPDFGITNAPDSATRPNIVLINTDDQRADTLHLLPNIQQYLVDKGVTFTNAIVPTPSCCPSRATLLSGQYVHNNGQFQQLTPNVPIFEETIQKSLQQSGYFTGTAGKYLHWVENDDPVPPYWDGWTNIKGGFYGVGANFDGDRQTVGGYTTDIVFERTKEYLRGFERENDNKPWFVYLAPLAPHSPFTAEYDLRNRPVPAYEPSGAYQEADISDKPGYLQHRTMDEATSEWFHEQRVRSLYSVDREVKQLVEYLELSGELDNTMIVFTSDNGYMLGDHQTFGKFVPWRKSVEVPLVVSWPGQTVPGTVSDSFVSHVDISRTILEVAGVNTNNLDLDGVNFFDNERDLFYMEYFEDPNNSGRINDWASLRTDEFQYTEWYAEGTNNVTFREYYDMIADPDQLENLYENGDPADDPNFTTLSATLRVHRTCTGDGCTVDNPFDN